MTVSSLNADPNASFIPLQRVISRHVSLTYSVTPLLLKHWATPDIPNKVVVGCVVVDEVVEDVVEVVVLKVVDVVACKVVLVVIEVVVVDVVVLVSETVETLYVSDFDGSYNKK